MYRKLSTAGVEDPELGRLKGVWRHTWSANQRLFHVAAGVVTQLRDAGIETLALSGTALVPAYAGSGAERRVHSADLLVRPDEAEQAVRLLEASGWQSESPRPLPGVTGGGANNSPFRGRHVLWLDHAKGERVGLHRVIAQELVMPLWQGAVDMGELWWASAEPVEIAGAATLMLCPTDQLLLACLHGPRAARGNVFWVTDVHTILTAAGSRIDWDRLTTDARNSLCLLAVLEPLEYLAAELGTPVPREALERLRSTPAGVRERLWWRARSRAVRAPLGRPVRMAAAYARASLGASPLRTLAGLPGFAWNYWRVRERLARRRGRILRRRRASRTETRGR